MATGLRLARFFGESEDFWIDLQSDHDSAMAQQALSSTLAVTKP